MGSYEMILAVKAEIDHQRYTDVTDTEGNITCSTFYIDVPTMTVARMSTAALDKRFSFNGTEDIKTLFELSTTGW